MALDAFVDSLDAIPEGIRPEYKEVKDGAHKGKFVLDVKPTHGYALDDVEGLKSAFQTAKATWEQESATTKSELDTAKSALTPYSGLKTKPSDIAKSLKRLEDLEKLDPANEADKIAQGKIDAFKESAQKEFNGKLEQEQAKSTTYRGQIERLIRDNALHAAISKADGIPELLMPVIANRVKVVEAKDGTLNTMVMDASGGVAQTWRGSQLENMTVDDLVESFKANETYGGAFKASGRTGTGTPPKADGSPQKSAQTFTAKEWLVKTSTANAEQRRELLQGAASGKYTISN